ncbi:protein kinase domain-containing protein [Streptomyces sudanensis]|uniref:protein kinase domain-containing protein n=1 Tax=Streptomyces sudanensis TaxID=436397 RepID=UPI0020CE62D6|nr:protein kinase [Streptomyces sudanensis]MCP9958260.1 protein kinase [Streptomyces sudanensis]MCQ0001217.1 protein kinase [Streptomyces sudanensis]
MAPGSEAGGGGVSDDGAPGRGEAVEFGAGGLVGDGRYRLTRRLGRGGMAEVFAAEDVRLGRTVAVKLLRADLAEDPVSKARFTREAQSVAGLNHHAIVAVYDSGEDEVNGQSVPYIVMELVEGRTIRELLVGAETMPPERALAIVSGVLEALAYSHQHGIVHRDIKPANVIITNSGAVKVMDFGIARALHGASTTMTQTGMVMGTPQYLSPEQALGKAVDHRSDLYATGCLLYELLALRPPFVGETPLSVVYQHVQDVPVPPSQVFDEAPPELDGLVMRALAKDPDDRFQSAEEMRGLIQYGLSMLQEQGGHTGTWSTGQVDPHEGGHTPRGGVAATAVMGGLAGPSTPSRPMPLHGDTSQAPILPPPNPDDGAYPGGYERGGGGRGKVLLFVAFALVAIVAGIVYAMNAGETTPGTDMKPTTSPTPSVSPTLTPTTPTPSASEPREETQQPGTSSGGGNGGGDRPSWPPRAPSYSRPPTFSTSGGTGDTGATTDGPTDGGDTTGTTDGGGDTTGTTDGGTTGGSTGDGGTGDGGTGDGGTTGSTDTGGGSGGDTTGVTGSGQQGGMTTGSTAADGGSTTGG